MTEKEKRILQSYLVNEDARLSDMVQELQARIRYRRVDVVDCVELACAINHYDSFREFRRIIDRLLQAAG